MKRRIAEPQRGVREHEFVAEPISMFAKISLTKLGSLGDRESESKKGGKKKAQALKTNKQKAMTSKLKQQQKKRDAGGGASRVGLCAGCGAKGLLFLIILVYLHLFKQFL